MATYRYFVVRGFFTSAFEITLKERKAKLLTAQLPWYVPLPSLYGLIHLNKGMPKRSWLVGSTLSLLLLVLLCGCDYVLLLYVQEVPSVQEVVIPFDI